MEEMLQDATWLEKAIHSSPIVSHRHSRISSATRFRYAFHLGLGSISISTMRNPTAPFDIDTPALDLSVELVGLSSTQVALPGRAACRGGPRDVSRVHGHFAAPDAVGKFGEEKTRPCSWKKVAVRGARAAS